MSGAAAWWTDPHFELLSDTQRREILTAWSEMRHDCAIVTGDISHGSTSFSWLRQLAEVFQPPIYFVLWKSRLLRYFHCASEESRGGVV